MASVLTSLTLPHSPSSRGKIPSASGLLLVLSCVRAPEPHLCPPLGEGDLVITEIRGDNGADQTLGEWIELWNAGDSVVDLRGLVVDVIEADGGSERIPITASVRVSPQSYVVLGNDRLWSPALFTMDVPLTLSRSGRGTIELYACDELIEHAPFALPKHGTYAFGGPHPPRADLNDDRARWCIDDHHAQPNELPTGHIGLPGTPGKENYPCTDSKHA